MLLIIPAAVVALILLGITGNNSTISDSAVKPFIQKTIIGIIAGVIFLPLAAAVVIWLAPFVLTVLFIYGCLRWFLKSNA